MYKLVALCAFVFALCIGSVALSAQSSGSSKNKDTAEKEDKEEKESKGKKPKRKSKRSSKSKSEGKDDKKKEEKATHYSMPWTIDDCKKALKVGMKQELKATIKMQGMPKREQSVSIEIVKAGEEKVTFKLTQSGMVQEHETTWKEVVTPTDKDAGFPIASSTKTEETIKIDLGEYKCIKFSTKKEFMGQEATQEIWVSKDQAGVIIKSVMTSQAMTITQVVTKIDNGEGSSEDEGKEGAAKNGKAKKKGEATSETEEADDPK